MKSMSLCSLLFLMPLLGVPVSVMGSPDQSSDGGVLEIAPAFPVFVRGEPIQFLLKVRNTGDKDIQINLGADGTGNLHVTVTGDGGDVTPAHPEYTGFRLLVVLQVPPAGVCSPQPFLLDDFIRIDEPGDYRLSVRVDKLATTTEFRILPDTESARLLLKERYAGLFKKWHIYQPPSELSIMRNALIFSRHPLAFDIQRTLVEQREWRDYKECKSLVNTMLQSHSKEAIQALITGILAHPDADALEKAYVLNPLREADMEKWPKPVHELLRPYRDAIKNSVPMRISG
jgi:hypothetical protein